MELSEIVAHLPSGAQTRIAKQVGVSKQLVSKVLGGGHKNSSTAERIIKEATKQAQAAKYAALAKAVRDKIDRMDDEQFLREYLPHLLDFPDKLPSLVDESGKPLPAGTIILDKDI